MRSWSSVVGAFRRTVQDIAWLSCPYRKCYPARTPLKSATLRRASTLRSLCDTNSSPSDRPHPVLVVGSVPCNRLRRIALEIISSSSTRRGSRVDIAKCSKRWNMWACWRSSFSNARGSCWRMSWLRSANCQEFQLGPEKSFERT